MTMLTIHLFLRTLDNDYQLLLRDDCMRTAAAYGAEVRVWSADSNAGKQVHQIEEAMVRRAENPMDCVLVSPVREAALVGVAHLAAVQDLPFAVLNRDGEFLQDLCAEFPSVPLFAVNPDQRQIGRLHGMQLKRVLPLGGKVLYIQGAVVTSSARERSMGMKEELDGSDLDMVMTYGDWSFESGKDAAAGWVRNGAGEDVFAMAVCAQNDAMALGAREVLLREAHDGNPELARVPVLGCDGCPAYGRRFVSSGDLTATIIVPSAAQPALDAIMKVRNGELLPPFDLTLPVASFPDLKEIGSTAWR